MTTPCDCPLPGPCPRHAGHPLAARQVKSAHAHQLCQTREDYRSKWDRESGNPVVAEPGLFRKIINYGTAVVSHAAGGFRHVSDAIFQARLAICQACPGGFWSKARGRCVHKKCGCDPKKKLRWADQACPEKYWTAEP